MACDLWSTWSKAWDLWSKAWDLWPMACELWSIACVLGPIACELWLSDVTGAQRSGLGHVVRQLALKSSEKSAVNSSQAAPMP
jgi:hypothetical protein